MLNKLFLAIIIVTGLTLSLASYAKAATCDSGKLGGSEVESCKVVYPCAGCLGYCGMFKANYSCSCGGPSCSCNPGGGTGCSSSGTSSRAICACESDGSSCSASGNDCGSGAYFSRDGCGCIISAGNLRCDVTGTPILYCFAAVPAPTATPGGGGGPVATATPAPVATATPIPTATPTPAIIGNIYNDPNDGTVAIGGGGMCVKSGAAPVGTSVANALIEAVKTSNGAVSAGLVTGSSYKITAGLVSGASDYTLALALPTPAAGVLTSYVCSCPAGANEYLCNYSNINANGTANFFVRQRCTRLKSSDAAAVIG